MKKLMKIVNRNYSGKFVFPIVFYLLLLLSLVTTKMALALNEADAEYWRMLEVKSEQWLELYEKMEKERAEELAKAYPTAKPYVEFIIQVCKENDADPIWVARIIDCESSGRADAVNKSSQATGLMQFMPSTWLTTPYAMENIFDPEMQIRAAVWMYKEGRQREWVCN